jgi:hypothetical protein
MNRCLHLLQKDLGLLGRRGDEEVTDSEEATLSVGPQDTLFCH